MAEDNKPKEKDALSGIETTGHEWDGIKELNLPAPRWWLLVWLVCCIYAVGYWFFYPAWPTVSGHTKGSLGWTEYKKLGQEQAEITAIRGEFSEQIKTHNIDEIQKDKQLYDFAVAGGRSMFKENCAACHGTGAAGGHGYPNLNDDDWLWGGKLSDIYTTIKYGVRSTSDQTRTSQMPAFGKDGILKQAEISDVADYVLSLSGGKNANAKGAEIFKNNCSSCHGETGKGNREFGAPNLADAIWLYGNTKQDIVAQVTNPKQGVMPTWETRLSDDTIKQLAIYVHSLGGGE